MAFLFYFVEIIMEGQLAQDDTSKEWRSFSHSCQNERRKEILILKPGVFTCHLELISQIGRE